MARSFPSKVRTLFLRTDGTKSPSFVLEVAQTPEQLARGLMFRAELLRHYGMLFVFPETGRHSFWMRQTYVPLDLAWLDARGRVMEATRLFPLDETRVMPAQPAKYAVELLAGTLSEYRVSLGDQLVALKD